MSFCVIKNSNGQFVGVEKNNQPSQLLKKIQSIPNLTTEQSILYYNYLDGLKNILRDENDEPVLVFKNNSPTNEFDLINGGRVYYPTFKEAIEADINRKGVEHGVIKLSSIDQITTDKTLTEVTEEDNKPQVINGYYFLPETSQFKVTDKFQRNLPDNTPTGFINRLIELNPAFAERQIVEQAPQNPALREVESTAKTMDDFDTFKDAVAYNVKRTADIGIDESEANYGDAKNINEIKSDLEKAGIQVEKVPQSSMSDGNYASFDGEKIKVTDENIPLQVLLHEIGEKVIWDLDKTKQKIEHANNIFEAVTTYGASRGNDAFADNFYLYFLSPKTLKELSPNVYAELNKLIPQNIKDLGKSLMSKYGVTEQTLKYNTPKAVESLLSKGQPTPTQSESNLALRDAEQAPQNKTQLAIQRNNGNPLNLAPNGQPSILYQTYKELGYTDQQAEELVSKTFTDEFGEWFGRWWETSEGVSKVVDSNGQPLVVYHGTNAEFREFNKDKTKELAFHFGTKLSAKERVRYNYGGDGVLIPVFLNVRNMARTGDFYEGRKLVESRVQYYIEQFNEGTQNIEEQRLIRRFENILKGDSPKLYDFYSELTGLKEVDFEKYIINTIEKLKEDRKQTNYNKSEVLQGLIYKNTEEGIGDDSYIVFSPNQIKSATENIGTFSAQSPDIRFSIIGEQGANRVIEEKELLDKAKQMLSNNESIQEIEKQTGWLYINDQWKKIRKDLLKSFQIKEDKYAIKNTPQPLKEILLDKSILSFYPDLANIQVIFYNEEYQDEQQMEGLFEEGATGKFDTSKGEKGTIFLRDSLDKETLEIIFAHEVTHAIQEEEDFPLGGNITTLPNKVAEIVGIEKGFTFNSLYERLSKEDLSKYTAEEKRMIESVKISSAAAISKDVFFLWDDYRMLMGEIDARLVEQLYDFVILEKNDFKSPLSKLYEQLLDFKRIEDAFIIREGSDSTQLSAQQNNSDLNLNDKETLQQTLTQLQLSGLADNVYFLTPNEIENKLVELGQSAKTTTQGFTNFSDIYINTAAVNPLELTLHEYSHIYLNKLKQQRPDLYARGIELVKSEEAQDIINFVKKNQPKLQEGSQEFNEEVLAEVIGRSSEMLIMDKKSDLKNWLLDVWEWIKQQVGLLDMTTEQVANLTLEEYASAVGVDMLSGEEIFGQEAQEYFTRNADRLPLTLQVFQRPEFIKMQGKQVNPITVLNSLNQSGIKQIEKDLIKRVIEESYQGQKKISYDELEATVRANIMPLERIFTSSYADYGMDNLGDGNYGEANTIILNAPIEHGVTGHFSGDFKASGRKNIKYVPKQLNDNTWVAVEEGYESQANDNNIYQYVGTAGTKEAVDEWIKNYENPRGYTKENTKVLSDEGWFLLMKDDNTSNIVQVDRTDINEDEDIHQQLLNIAKERYATATPINKGMFGHIRVWQDGNTMIISELQSDYFQKNNARKNILESRKDYKEAFDKKQKEEGYILQEREIYLKDEVHNDLLKTIEKNDRVTIKPHRLELYDGSFGEEALWLFVDDKPILVSKYSTEGYNEEMQRIGLLKGRNNLVALKEMLGEDFANNLQKEYDLKLKSFSDRVSKVNKEFEKNSQEIISKLSPQEKQFIASQKEWEKRMVREAIKEAALSGATELRFPTPYTLSVIEAYISNEGDKVPYNRVEVAEGGEFIIPSKVTDSDLKVGDIIYLGDGEGYYVIKSNNNSITVVTKSVIDDRIRTREKIAEKLKGTLEIGEDLEKVIDSYIKWNDVILRKDALDVINNLKDDELSSLEETFGQPSTYNKKQSKETFDIETSLDRDGDGNEKETYNEKTGKMEIDRTQRTVAYKYLEIAEILKQERGENNFEIVTDDNGFDWYSTKIAQEEVNIPVIAFQQLQETDNSVSFNSPSQEAMLEKMIEDGQVERFCRL